jgi:voltage-gated potassium channel
VVLMLVGLAIVGVVTAALAAWLVSLTTHPASAREVPRDLDLRQISEQLAALRASVEALRRGAEARSHRPSAAHTTDTIARGTRTGAAPTRG